jgi:hypothetical protein
MHACLMLGGKKAAADLKFEKGDGLLAHSPNHAIGGVLFARGNEIGIIS